MSNSSCPDGVGWIQTALDECVTTNAQIASAFVGLSSIAFWLVAQAPQIYMNYKNGSCESLAFLFLLQWLLGDVTNLLGAILSGQLATQIYTAVYFCSIDAVMMSQYMYYRYKEKKDEKKAALKTLYALLAVCLFSVSGLSLIQLPSSGHSNFSSEKATGRALMSITSFDSAKSTVGYVLGIISALLYLCSRVPQIVKNHQRKSIGGLSFAMFFMAVMGNVTYALSVFMYSVDGDFLIDKLPWLAGSVGTLFFDFTIFSQFILYRGNPVPEHSHLADVEHGHDDHHDDHDHHDHHEHDPDHHEESELLQAHKNAMSSNPKPKGVKRQNSPLMLPISKKNLNK